MGFLDRLFKINQSKNSRFARAGEDDEMLLPHQISALLDNLDSVNTDVLFLADPSDEMLPEYTMFVPNLLAEFNENPDLAMVHGLGTAHAWIDTRKLRQIVAKTPAPISDYRSLFRAITVSGYDVKKIKYITFRSQLSR
jgi:hypothetical protein